MAHTLITAAATWAVLGGRSLTVEASAIEQQLECDDLAAARVQVHNLGGRDTTRLDAGEVARAGVESLAENTSDAVVAPLVWGGIAGVPGLLGYRAINTLDAMVDAAACATSSSVGLQRDSMTSSTGCLPGSPPV